MDEIDLANERAEQFTADAVRAARVRKAFSPSTGICQSCHERIEAERLRANPTARLCCDCAAEDEAARKRAQRLGG
jgi:phage/conjugal plasmid C-4 type zinc finger TraR family protein